ncbi:hypothetical protein N7513_003158 [Penicillium frequentans]|nr:hypothetical protein N7513_003158 [Penicillium glabrum]
MSTVVELAIQDLVKGNSHAAKFMKSYSDVLAALGDLETPRVPFPSVVASNMSNVEWCFEWASVLLEEAEYERVARNSLP